MTGGRETALRGGFSYSLSSALREAEDRVRHIRLLKRHDLFRRERKSKGGHGIFQMVRLRRADDGGGDAGRLQQPGQGNLCARDSAHCGDLAHPVYDLVVGLLGPRI